MLAQQLIDWGWRTVHEKGPTDLHEHHGEVDNMHSGGHAEQREQRGSNGKTEVGILDSAYGHVLVCA